MDQIIINHDKHQDQFDIVLKSFVPKVGPQQWMPSHILNIDPIKPNTYLNLDVILFLPP